MCCITLSCGLCSPSAPMSLTLSTPRLGLSALKGSPATLGSGIDTGRLGLSFQLVTWPLWQTKALAHPDWEIIRTQKSFCRNPDRQQC